MQTGQRFGKSGAYQRVAAWSSVAEDDPQRLILMLYDGALDRIATARGCMQHGLLSEKGQLITRALEILGELRGTLDLVRGGSIAAHLDDLYDYISRRLVEANASNRPELLDEATALLRELRLAWSAIAAGTPRAPG
jgi:flagellar protein FliS